MKNPYTNTVRKWILRVMLAFVVIVATVYIYWSFAPYDNIINYKLGNDGNSADYIMGKDSYKQGETGYYTIDYCKSSDVTPVVKRYFVDGIKLQASDSRTVLKFGCHTQEVNFTIPKSLPPGRWHLEVNACYPINPVREPICFTNKSKLFLVDRDDAGSYGEEE